MATTITQGGSTITPTAVLGYAATRQAQTIVHEILGNATPDVTLRPALKRTGTLELGFQGASSESNSAAAVTLLSNSTAAFVLASTERTSINMTFVVPQGGRVERELEDSSRDAWIVRVDFQEST